MKIEIQNSSCAERTRRRVAVTDDVIIKMFQVKLQMWTKKRSKFDNISNPTLTSGWYLYSGADPEDDLGGGG